jgi:hypothetical protein
VQPAGLGGQASAPARVRTTASGRNGHSGEGSSRYVVVNAKVLLDSADALQEVIDFFREARDVLGSDFKCVDPKTDVFELGLNVCKPFAHLNA